MESPLQLNKDYLNWNFHVIEEDGTFSVYASMEVKEAMKVQTPVTLSKDLKEAFLTVVGDIALFYRAKLSCDSKPVNLSSLKV